MPQKVSPTAANISFIKNMFLFSGLTDAEKDAVCTGGAIYRYSKKEMLYQQGDPITHFYIVCEGTVGLSQETADGCQITNHLRVPGDIINSTAAFLPGNNGQADNGIHQVNAAAAVDSLILDFPIIWLKNAVQHYNLIALNLLSSLSQRAANMEVEAKNQVHMSSHQLLACFLARICVAMKLNPKRFELPYSKALVASRLRMMQETLSRAIPKLEECGVSIKGRSVTLHDLPKLEKNLCSHCSGATKCRARRILQDNVINRSQVV